MIATAIRWTARGVGDMYKGRTLAKEAVKTANAAAAPWEKTVTFSTKEYLKGYAKDSWSRMKTNSNKSIQEFKENPLAFIKAHKGTIAGELTLIALTEGLAVYTYHLGEEKGEKKKQHQPTTSLQV